ncbi:MAG: hypothetical protein NZ561_11940 [Phycisphaerae bacterium]|nr:hypothetical protein [Phycisphaerae bacterium]MDW8261802.1 hypothetical protein [Phycisphaerales bacterium]
MNWFVEILLGLERGFLSRQGELSLGFHPDWPWQQHLGAATWNLLLLGLGVFLIARIYRQEARSRPIRLLLAAVRTTLVLLVLALLNRPVLTLGQSRVEPSILPILIDGSLSMRVRDAGDAGMPLSRLEAVQKLLLTEEMRLARELTREHQLRWYRFDTSVQEIESPSECTADAQATDVHGAVRQVMSSLQGQRVAGIVLFTDGRDSPARNTTETLGQISAYGVPVYPVPVGSDRPPMNLAIQNVAVQDAAFVGDIVNFRVSVRGTGLPQGHRATLRLIDRASGQTLQSLDGASAEQSIPIEGDATVETELLFRPTAVGTLDVAVEIQREPGEMDFEDNIRPAQLAVLDARINVLYVDGAPRWEYRYLKNEMIRDKSVEISCLLTSADPTFRQEGDRPITRFPESINELMEYDVVVLGDVDPRQFSDFQLQMISEFVGRLGGGFAMVSGPAYSPHAYRGTAIEPLLPVQIDQVQPQRMGATITKGFRPALTRQGAGSSIFRFFADRQENERFIAEQLQPLFWYCRGVAVKPGVGEVYAEHPSDTGPDGRRAPLLVLGRFGAGRTIFSAIDDSWRWRFYTGETIFDTYWVQQLRYLARGRKLGQRQVALSAQRPVFELGEQAHFTLRILNPQLLPQLPEQLRLEIVEEPTGLVVWQHALSRNANEADSYTASFPAERIGSFSARVRAIAPGVDDPTVPFSVRIPRVELSQPQVDRAALLRLASQTQGQVIELPDAARLLPSLIPSAAKVIPVETARPLWDAPLVLMLFVLLITLEWIIRKLVGMV